ncbi:MAG: hypothetical protein AAGD14_02395 [Planctomycetota bacterium]
MREITVLLLVALVGCSDASAPTDAKSTADAAETEKPKRGSVESLLPSWARGAPRVEIRIAANGETKLVTEALPRDLRRAIRASGSGNTIGELEGALFVLRDAYTARQERRGESSHHKLQNGRACLRIPVIMRVSPKTAWGHLAQIQTLVFRARFHVGVLAIEGTSRMFPAHSARFMKALDRSLIPTPNRPGSGGGPPAVTVELLDEGYRLVEYDFASLDDLQPVLEEACAWLQERGVKRIYGYMHGPGDRSVEEVVAVRDRMKKAGVDKIDMWFHTDTAILRSGTRPGDPRRTEPVNHAESPKRIDFDHTLREWYMSR